MSESEGGRLRDSSMPGRDKGSEGFVNALWARVFLDELARSGLTDLCVAPGSRSTPLVLAAVRDGRFRMIPILDERSAGYFALGLGKAGGSPAAVITTSGTAAANLFPAIIEASMGEVPLVALTADRPRRLRDADANQTMDQVRLFGTFPRAFFDIPAATLEDPDLRHLRGLGARAVALAKGPPAGPVHLNFPFEKPLEPPLGGMDLPAGVQAASEVGVRGREDGEPYVRVVGGSLRVRDEEETRLRRRLSESSRGVIVAGPVPDPGAVGPAVLALAAATGFPVLADPLSGGRFAPAHGAHVVGGYDLFLRSPRARHVLAPDLILRVGASPTSAATLDFLAEAGDAAHVVVDQGSRWKDHLARAGEYVRAAPDRLLARLAVGAARRADPRWRLLWEEAESRTRDVLEGRGPGELLEWEILAAVVETLPEEASLLVASSMPIRDLDAFVFPSSKTLHVFGNRGVSGIDGLVSTTLGVAAGPGGKGPTVGVLGDLAFFHDQTGLMTAKSLRLPVVFVVLNNDGGGIFHMLPIRNHEPSFTPFFAMPHGLDFRNTATLYGMSHSSAASLADFAAHLQSALETEGPAIVEVATRREETHARRRQLVEAVVEAMQGLGSDNS